MPAGVVNDLAGAFRLAVRAGPRPDCRAPSRRRQLGRADPKPDRALGDADQLPLGAAAPALGPAREALRPASRGRANLIRCRELSVRIGYKASAEQFAPRELLEQAVEAERRGMELIATSDHFQPWRHHGGHSSSALTWLGAAGEATARAVLGTSVLTPTLRYHPSIIAQAFGTLGALYPGRVFLGVGSGEAMNETPATGEEFPGRKERRLRLAEAIVLIRRLFTEGRVDFSGDYYSTAGATIYDRPDEPVPIFVAASGPLAAKLAGAPRRRLHLHQRQGPRSLHDAAGEGRRGGGGALGATRRRSAA